MMRTLSVLALVASLAAAVWAGRALVIAAQAPARNLPAVVTQPVASEAVMQERVSPPFLAIYGTPDAPAPRAGAAPPPAFPYALKGLIVVGDVRWAVLSRNDVDQVVREGEVLEGGAEVLQVRAEGIELATAGGPMILGFDADTPVAMAEVAGVQDLSDSSGPKGNFTTAPTAAVLFQDMTSDEILAALERAEERRIAPSDEAE